MRFSQATQKSALSVVPLLRSIAREVVERSHAIFTLEAQAPCRERIERPVTEADHLLVARLSTERRELNRSVKELQGLGWERDKKEPLQFRCKGLRGDEAYTWKPEDSFFFRTAEI